MADYLRELPLIAALGDPTNPPASDFSRGAGDVVLLFDDASEEKIVWKMQLLGGSGEIMSAVHIVGNFSMAAANTGTKGVVLGCRIQSVTPDNSEAWSTSGWGTQVKDRVAIDNDADQVVSFDLDMSANDDGMEIGDTVWVELSRVGDDTTTETDGDDAVGDMQLESVGLEYTAA